MNFAGRDHVAVRAFFVRMTTQILFLTVWLFYGMM